MLWVFFVNNTYIKHIIMGNNNLLISQDINVGGKTPIYQSAIKKTEISLEISLEDMHNENILIGLINTDKPLIIDYAYIKVDDPSDKLKDITDNIHIALSQGDLTLDSRFINSCDDGTIHNRHNVLALYNNIDETYIQLKSISNKVLKLINTNDHKGFRTPTPIKDTTYCIKVVGSNNLTLGFQDVKLTIIISYISLNE